MFRFFRLAFGVMFRLFRRCGRLVLENLVLRQQVSVLKRKNRRPRLAGMDRWFWVAVRQVWPGWKASLLVVKRETVVEWRRAFRRGEVWAIWRTKGEYATLSCVALRTCTVAVRDIRDVEHSIEVTAETLYEAIATALATLRQDNWVGEIGQGLTTVTVVVQQPPVKHEVKMKDFVSWLGRQGRSPAEVVLKQKLEKILGNVNHARTARKG